jgi:hypothetical protein
MSQMHSLVTVIQELTKKTEASWNDYIAHPNTVLAIINIFVIDGGSLYGLEIPLAGVCRLAQMDFFRILRRRQQADGRC